MSMKNLNTPLLPDLLPDAYEISFLEMVLFSGSYDAAGERHDLYDAMADYFKEKQSSFANWLKEGKDIPAGMISHIAIDFMFRYLRHRIKVYKSVALKARTYEDIIYETMKNAFSED